MEGRWPRIWVIDPSLNKAEDQGVAEILRGWSGDSRLMRPALVGDGPSVADGYRVDAVVLMGSAASVHDDLPWLSALRRWLRPILSGDVRCALLGICFGHQLIADIAGARVDWLNDSHEKRVGVEQTRVRNSRLLSGDADLRVVVSHRETVVEAPEGYRVTASRPGVPFDGLEHESLEVFSYQFHPEAREEFAARAGIAEAEIDERLRQDSRTVVESFRTLCEAKKKRAGG
jgi:GMP synthase (glutamine-hydrolysing)